MAQGKIIMRSRHVEKEETSMEEAWANFNSNELEIARNASISRVASDLGYTPKRMTNVWYTLEEHDSVIIKNDRSYSRNSVTAANGKKEGGTAIDFVKNFTGEDNLVKIVQYLCELEGYSRSMDEAEKNRRILKAREIRAQAQEKGAEGAKQLILPPKSETYKVLYAYLIKTRKMAQETVDFFVRNHSIYESKENYFRKGKDGEYLLDADGRRMTGTRHNIVFLGTNKTGETRFASKRGTMDNYGIRYRGNVTGSDLSCGFQVNAPDSRKLYVFEAAIDLMSYCELSGDYNETNKLALSTVSDGALIQYLKEHGEVTDLTFCLDHDYAGLKAMCLLTCKYLGYQTHIETVGAARIPDAYLAGEDVVALKLHSDEEVHWNKELKESDTEALQGIMDALIQLKSRTKYAVDYETPAYGKDFNESLAYQKEHGICRRNPGKVYG